MQSLVANLEDQQCMQATERAVLSTRQTDGFQFIKNTCTAIILLTISKPSFEHEAYSKLLHQLQHVSLPQTVTQNID